jgi:peptide/nickel transport system substrate-binding protein
MQVTNGGPFDAKSYGGDAAKAKKVRQAFLKTIPRQEIVDKLIKPLQDDAVIRESNVFVPGSEGYKASEEVNGYSAYDEVDIDGAKALLAEVGATTPIDVRFIYGEGNTRRAQEYELIRQTSKEAGFNLIDGASSTWGNDVFAKPDVYDAALFGWQSTSLAVGESAANYQTGGANNPYGWSNPEIDKLFKQLDTETDAAKQQQILVDVEKLIVDEAWTVPIFQFPGVTAWNDKITGVSPSSLSPTYFWNFWDWAPVTGETK